MLRSALFSLILLVSLSSTSSILRKSLTRRQADAQPCNAIDGFECKCSHFRVTCTTTRDYSSPLHIISSEKNKYQSVELVIAAQREIQADDRTFEPVKDLYKNEGDTYEFRIKFEKFTALRLVSPGLFNRVFPDNTPPHARKIMALEIYNPDVAPNDDVHLFQNLNVHTLELYGLYPFRGTFQQLFDGANIKFLRLSGGEIRSDLSHDFTGTVSRLELAKQADELSVQNFPVYPAHELIINAFYIKNFNTDHPPNYSNLGELRIFSTDRIPANAFQQFPNIHTLSISTDADIDPQALNGLNNLEKLSVKEPKPSLKLLNSVPNVKEFETNVEKLDDDAQCQLVGKLANGQVAVQDIPNGRECTCISAYLSTAVGRTPCEAHGCDRSTCVTIKNNYDPSIRAFKAPAPIRRADGSDAFYPREPRVYSTSYQVSPSDRDKLYRGAPSQHGPHTPTHDDSQRPSGSIDDQHQHQHEHEQRPESQSGQHQDENRDDTEQKGGEGGDHQQDGKDHQHPHGTDGHDKEGHEHHGKEGGEKQAGEDGNQGGSTGESPTEGEGGSSHGEGKTAEPTKKKMNWLPIIIIIAALAILILIGLGYYFIRKKRTTNKDGYNQAATNDQPTAGTTATRA